MIIIYAIIGGFCLISLITVMIMHIVELSTPKVSLKEDTTNIEVVDFDTLFDNNINKQGYSINETEKIDETKDIVYTNYSNTDKSDGKYDFTVNIPIINIDNDSISEVNTEINDIFKKKVTNIMRANEDGTTVYTVSYTAYLNSNILSLAIKSTLKEGDNPQRVIIKGYTYNLSTKEQIDIDDVMLIKQLDSSEIEKSIKSIVNSKIKENEKLIETGYNVYKRNIDDEIYKTENIDNFFYGPDGVLYVIYAYGNNEFTSEFDIVPIK
jgi:hypothetical protein